MPMIQTCAQQRSSWDHRHLGQQRGSASGQPASADLWVDEDGMVRNNTHQIVCG